MPILFDKPISSPAIVFDLDNTVIDYSRAFAFYAKELPIPCNSQNFSKISLKKSIFDHFSELQGHNLWLKLQHQVYTTGLKYAQIDSHFFDCLELIKKMGFEPWIVSHKSERSYYDSESPLREYSKNFLFRAGVYNWIPPSRVILTETQDKKIEAISKIKPALFIDDLESVISDNRLSEFNRIHFSNTNTRTTVSTNQWATILLILRTISELKLKRFRLEANKASSKNQLIRIAGETKSYLLKIFAKTPQGREQATHEFEIGNELEKNGLRLLPKRIVQIDHSVTMEYLNECKTAEPHLAYAALVGFLKKTRTFKSHLRSLNDASTQIEYLSNLHNRLNHLKLDASLRKDILSILLQLADFERFGFDSVELRFVPSDFIPSHYLISANQGYFLDFESAGMGDPCRFLAHVLFHPRSQLQIKECEPFFGELEIDPDRFNRMIPFALLEWVLILLKEYQGYRGRLARERLRQFHESNFIFKSM